MFTSKPNNFNEFKKYLTNENLLYYVDNKQDIISETETVSNDYLNKSLNELNNYKNDSPIHTINHTNTKVPLFVKNTQKNQNKSRLQKQLRSQNFNILKKCIENVKSTS